MGQVVRKVSNETLVIMKEAYQSGLKPTPPNAVFSAQQNGTTITAYQSGKVLFQGKNSEQESQRWTGEVVTKKKKKIAPKQSHAYTPDEGLFTQSIIGSDEAGTGDYFGPVTVAAAYVKSDQIELLRELGVRDSKNLTDQAIEKIAQDILLCEIPYSLMVLPNPKYNQLQANGWTQGKMKSILHHSVIEKLLEKIAPEKPNGILIDQFSQPGVYLNHLKSEHKTLPDSTYFITKAESHSIAVATASILARARFVREMDRLSQKVGVTIPKGASAKLAQVASRLIRDQREAFLETIAKVHFANTQKAAAYLK